MNPSTAVRSPQNTTQLTSKAIKGVLCEKLEISNLWCKCSKIFRFWKKFNSWKIKVSDSLIPCSKGLFWSKGWKILFHIKTTLAVQVVVLVWLEQRASERRFSDYDKLPFWRETTWSQAMSERTNLNKKKGNKHLAVALRVW